VQGVRLGAFREERFGARGSAVPGQSVYVVGAIAALGNWSPASAIKLDPDGSHPTWSGILANLLPNAAIEWKCIKRRDTGDTTAVDMWQPGSNNAFTSAPAGFGGITRGEIIHKVRPEVPIAVAAKQRLAALTQQLGLTPIS
jgi:Starch binding domain.